MPVVHRLIPGSSSARGGLRPNRGLLSSSVVSQYSSHAFGREGIVVEAHSAPSHRQVGPGSTLAGAQPQTRWLYQLLPSFSMELLIDFLIVAYCYVKST